MNGRVKKLQFKVDDLVWFFCPRKRPRLGPKWQLLTTGPWKVERVLNSVNYVIRRIGGRDRRVVHVDRLQRYVEAAQDGVVPANQPRPNCKDLLSSSRPRGRVLANLRPNTVEVEETSQQIGRPQRLRFEPARLRGCKQMSRRTSSDEAEIDGMIYICRVILCCRKRFVNSSDVRPPTERCCVVRNAFLIQVMFDYQQRFCVRNFVLSRDSRPRALCSTINRDYCVRHFVVSRDSQQRYFVSTEAV